MQSQLPAQMLQQVWAVLSPQEKTALQNAVAKQQVNSPIGKS